MVQIIVDIDEKTDKKVRMYMALHNISDKRIAASKLLEDIEFVGVEENE